MFYQELTLLPSKEAPLGLLLSKVFSILHKEFANVKEQELGEMVRISLPRYDSETKRTTLGNKIRLFSETKQILEVLKVRLILENLREYVHVMDIKPVPDNVHSYACFSRYQAKSVRSNRNLARAFAKRNGTSYEEEIKRISSRVQKNPHYPFVMITSSSNKQTFKLFIMKEEKAECSDGEITTYGLSKKATVPIF